MKKIIFTLVVILLLPAMMLAQQATIQSSISTNTILLGDPIKIQTSITYNPLTQSVIAPSSQQTFEHFETVAPTKIDTVNTPQNTTITYTQNITSFDSGFWKIPIQEFTIKSLSNNENTNLYTDSGYVQVNIVPVNINGGIKDVEGGLFTPQITKKIMAFMLIGLAILGIIIFLFIKRKKNIKTIKKEDPWKIALQELQKTDNKKWLEKEEYKPYHSEITETIKTYLQNQFDIACLDKTTSEILPIIQQHEIVKDFYSPLQTIFTNADMVKFAKQNLSLSEHQQSMQLAKDVVMQTKTIVQTQLQMQASTNE